MALSKELRSRAQCSSGNQQWMVSLKSLYWDQYYLIPPSMRETVGLSAASVSLQFTPSCLVKWACLRDRMPFRGTLTDLRSQPMWTSLPGAIFSVKCLKVCLLLSLPRIMMSIPRSLPSYELQETCLATGNRGPALWGTCLATSNGRLARPQANHLPPPEHAWYYTELVCQGREHVQRCESHSTCCCQGKQHPRIYLNVL